MSLRELNSLAPWRWDRSNKPVGDASLRDFAEVRACKRGGGVGLRDGDVEHC